MANIYEIITEKILDRIEEAEKTGIRFTWIRPWSGGARFALSYGNQQMYHGVNQVVLDNGEYISYKALMDYKKTIPEAEAEKIKIKKGCHKYPVFYYGTTDKLDKDGNPIQRQMPDGSMENEKTFFVRFYSVFHIEDIENLPSHFPAEHYEHTADADSLRLEEYIKAYARAEGLTMDFVKDGGRCFYRPSQHMVRVPEKEGFKSLYGYYGSVLHELIHSTSKGLGRELGSGFGSTQYCKEELVAEIGSQMALNQFGIVPDNEKEFDNDVAYISGWASYLKEHKKEILVASNRAMKAVEYFIEVAERQLTLEKANIEKLQREAMQREESSR